MRGSTRLAGVSPLDGRVRPHSHRVYGFSIGNVFVGTVDFDAFAFGAWKRMSSCVKLPGAFSSKLLTDTSAEKMLCSALLFAAAFVTWR